ncbi:MAG: ATP-grasp domain-containing protein [Gammaproteobacteria bacterium]
MKIPEFVLVIANSGRMLTMAAARAGIKPLVVDLFADSDTCASSVECVQIPKLTVEHIAPVVNDYIRRFSLKHLIYGSGFENHPESLEYLSGHLTILGNPPDTFARMQNKVEFFSALASLGIAYPEVAFTRPDDERTWLLKPMQGCGGIGIRRGGPEPGSGTLSYWQRYLPGTAHSALFLADGREARVIGFNTQWAVKLSAGEEFVFSGVINHCDLSDKHRRLLAEWISRCVLCFGLKGLNSLDFIRADGQCRVLEINARPPVSMQLYDDLLTRHIHAAQGCLNGELAESAGCKGIQIVYADRDLQIPFGFEWPEECFDRPASGVVCRKGHPVCSIIARRNEPKQVLDQLNRIQQQIVNKMKRV